MLPRQSCDFLETRPKQHISIPWFLKWGKHCLPPKLLLDVVTGLKLGFRTRYRGKGEFVRDYSNTMKPEEEKKATEKAREMVKKGWGAGPFTTPPFPNAKCPNQAIVTKSFTIPKHKWIDDGALRLIFHKSFPLGRSINSLTPRHDIKTYFPSGKFQYFSLWVLISIIAIAGRGCFLTQFDAADAYKQLYVRLEDLYQQVFAAGGQFWVDFCACFGSLYGNDIYSSFGNAHCLCLALTARLRWLFVYV